MDFNYSLSPEKPTIGSTCSIITYTSREVITIVPLSICGTPNAKFSIVPSGSKLVVGSNLENGSFIPDVAGHYQIEVMSEFNVSYIIPRFKGDAKGRTSEVYIRTLDCYCSDSMTIPVHYGDYEFDLKLNIDNSNIVSGEFIFDSTNEKLKNVLNSATCKDALNIYCNYSSVSGFVPDNLYQIVNELVATLNGHFGFGYPHEYGLITPGIDTINRIKDGYCLTESGLIQALNDVRTSLASHGVYAVHKRTTTRTLSSVPACHDLASAMILAVNMQRIYLVHISDLICHSSTDMDYYLDSVNYTMLDFFKQVFDVFDLDQNVPLENNNETTSLLSNRGFNRIE